jgi:damage-control phosphatase, subfamily I
MKTYQDCIPCFFKQALRAGNIATSNKEKIKQLIKEVEILLGKIPRENTPPETAALIYQKISEITGNPDPFQKIKVNNIAQALKLYPDLKRLVTSSDDRLLTAVRLAIAGNVIDMGIDKKFDLETEIGQTMQKQFAVFDYELFKRELLAARNILYLGDNAAEAVFDRILIEELGKPVTFVVRGIPVINDITQKEAQTTGIDQVARVISSGSIAPGTVLSYCNQNFISEFNNADLIISKGQGNYEGLSAVDRSIFFLLKAKCKVIADHIGVQENDILLKGINL